MKALLLMTFLGLVCPGLAQEVPSNQVAAAIRPVPVLYTPLKPGASGLKTVDVRTRQLHRLMEVQVVLASELAGDTRFEYCTRWFDAGGIEIPSFPGSWFSGDIPSLGTAFILEIAPSPDAVSYAIECREITRDRNGRSHTQPISLCIRPD